MTLHRNARGGITLLETLTAIFIMGVGMLALLTLFPVGALSMARAVRDDRAATIAANAAAVAAAFDLRHDANVRAALDASGPIAGFENGPGSPVFVDPHYHLLLNTQAGFDFLGRNAPVVAADLRTTPGLMRATPTFTTNSQQVNRFFTFQDEIEFDTIGSAKGSPVALSAPLGTSIRRPGTYTIAYSVRRPRHAAAELIDMAVIVYSLRPLDRVQDAELTPYLAANTTTPLGAAPGTQLRAYFVGPDKPNFARNPWLVDVTRKPGADYVQGHYYKVENVTEESATSLILDLDRPLKSDVYAFVHLDKAIAVVERGTTWRP